MANKEWTRDDFARGVLSELRHLEKVQTKSTGSLRESVTLSHATVSTGHPFFQDLTLGESDHCSAVAMFIDLQDFTGRTFWDSPAQVVRLAQAVLTQVAYIVTSHGGYILGLRGDGLFACFGPHPDQPEVNIGLALGAGAFALDATKNSLNELLTQSGIAPVQLRVGADYGRLDFIRTGTNEASEVNIIGFAANFAAKCEKYAKAWEFVVGEGFKGQIPTPTPGLFTAHDKSPKKYTRNYVDKFYRFYDVAWTSLLGELGEVQEALQGNPTSSVRIG